jgi:hypothetical protein
MILGREGGLLHTSRSNLGDCIAFLGLQVSLRSPCLNKNTISKMITIVNKRQNNLKHTMSQFGKDQTEAFEDCPTASIVRRF